MTNKYIAKCVIESKEKYGIGYNTIRRFGLKLALFIYDRADRKCEICGSKIDLTIHHKNNKGSNLIKAGHPELVDNDINNLIVLCRSCHGRIHGKEGKGKKHNKGSGRKAGGINGTFLRKGREKEYMKEYYQAHKDYFRNYNLRKKENYDKSREKRIN